VLSRSQRQTVAELLIKHAKTPGAVEKQLIKSSTAGLEKGVKFLLVDPFLRQGKDIDNPLDCKKTASLLALLSIKGKEKK